MAKIEKKEDKKVEKKAAENTNALGEKKIDEAQFHKKV